jgi:hypothetical protein
MKPRTTFDSRRNHHHKVLSPNSAKTSSWMVLRLNPKTSVSRAPHARPPHPGPLSRQSSTVPATRSALPHVHACVCPRCQPLWLVTQLLWFLGQVPAFVLRRSRSIDTNPFDLHRRPLYLCSTPANHKSRDMVAQHKYSRLG